METHKKGFVEALTSPDPLEGTIDYSRLWKVKNAGELARVIESGKNKNWELIMSKVGGPDELWKVYALTGAKTAYDILNMPVSMVTDVMKLGEGSAGAVSAMEKDEGVWSSLVGFGSDGLRLLAILAPGWSRLNQKAS